MAVRKLLSWCIMILPNCHDCESVTAWNKRMWQEYPLSSFHIPPSSKIFRINRTKDFKSLKNSKIKIIWSQIREFCACIFYALSISVLSRNWWKCAIKLARKSCRKAPVALQRGPYGIATGTPLQRNGAAFATPGGLRGRTEIILLSPYGIIIVFLCGCCFQNEKMKRLVFWYVFLYMVTAVCCSITFIVPYNYVLGGTQRHGDTELCNPLCLRVSVFNL